jgi:hypothetical protein
MTNSILPVPTASEKAILDSGCRSHLVKSDTLCHTKTPTTHGVRVSIANGQVMTATHNAILSPPHLPVQLNSSDCKASVHPDLQNSLISLGQLCDNGCDYVLLDKHHASIIQNGVTSIIGQRDTSNGMWLVDLQPSGAPMVPPARHPTYQHRANSAYEQKTKAALIDFLHRACFSPPISTWVQAIEDNFSTTWPGLSADAVRKFLPKSTCHCQRAPQVQPQEPPVHV